MYEDVFDKDYEEDTDSDEEFEKKFEDSIQAHKELSSRPSSSSSRPKTASRYREDTESRTNLVASAVLQVYFRISKFLSSKKLSKSQILAQFGEYSTSEKFKENFETLGFELSDSEVSFIFRDSGIPKSGVIRIADVYNKLITEAREDEEETPKSSKSNTEKLRKEAEKLLKGGSPKRIKVHSRKKNENKLQRPSSCSSRLPRPPSTPSSRKDSYIKNYLRETKIKEYKNKVDLNNTLERCKREFEYEIVKKMGEANEIMSGINSDKTFRCIRKEDRSLKCHIYIKENFVEEISLENFIREWKRIKNMKTKAVEPTSSQLASKTVSTTNAKINKNVRQEELKKLVLETRDLTNSLKLQLKILEDKGIVRRNPKKESLMVLNSRT